MTKKELFPYHNVCVLFAENCDIDHLSSMNTFRIHHKTLKPFLENPRDRVMFLACNILLLGIKNTFLIFLIYSLNLFPQIKAKVT